MSLKSTLLLLPILALAANDLSAQEQFKHRPGYMELSGRMIARPLQDGPNLEAARDRLQASLIKYDERIDTFIISVPEGMTEDALSAELMATGDYEYVEPDWICYPLNTPNDSRFGNQWHHQNMESELGWNTLTDASSIIAAYTDTGIDTNHPDLVNNLIDGYNQVSGLWQSQGGDMEDINGHGTYVAGCIGAEGNNGFGVAGVAWKIQIMPIRVSESSGGGAYLSDITGGAMVAIDNGASTASSSYSGVENSSVGTAGTYIKGQGGLYFYAAGNSDQNHSSFDYPDVIIVGATRSNDARASWSSYGLAVDCVAPGVSIETTSVGGGYSAPSGTSFSTPLTNGVAAMIYANNPGISAQAVEDILLDSCDDLGAAGEDNIYGHGRVNLRKALEASPTSPLVLTLGTITGGAIANADVADCTPSAQVIVAYSLQGLGSSFEWNTGMFLGIANNTVVLNMIANAAGIANGSSFVPSRGTGRTVWVQACEAGNVSNIHSSVIQ
ncbi:MAG: S8 family serine peptidase [Planctomycetota bacterium]|jgi:subtilisin family serine protease|nr:S8 family serine peptidase [Planctomycetota bacterium]